MMSSYQTEGITHLVSQFRFEHLGVLGLLDVGPGHLLEGLVSDLEPLGEVEAECLGPVGEDVEGDLRPLPLHVGDEPLQEGGRLHLVSDPLDLRLVLEQLVQLGAVLDDKSGDGEEGEEEHVNHVESLASLRHRVYLEQSPSLPSLLHFYS